jgi:hypothetical protein
MARQKYGPWAESDLRLLYENHGAAINTSRVYGSKEDTAMLEVIGEILPEAIAIAFNPVAIIAVILVLMSRRGKNKALGYIIGWVIGLWVIGAAIYLLMEANRGQSSAMSRNIPGIQLLLGLAFLGMAFNELRLISRQKHNLPNQYKWFSKLDSLTVIQVFLIATAMAALNLKNIGLVLSASSSMISAGMFGPRAWAIFGLFILLGSSPIIVPVFYDYIRSPHSETRLKEWRDWLLANNALVLFILFLIMGAKLIGKGMSGL